MLTRRGELLALALFGALLFGAIELTLLRARWEWAAAVTTYRQEILICEESKK